MALTSKDVNDQSFNLARKGGYEVDEVDEFLESVAAELDYLNGRIAELTNQLEVANSSNGGSIVSAGGVPQRELDERDARIAQLEKQVNENKADGNAIAQALIIAQRSADEILANANGAAETTRQDASDEAQRILDKANAEKQRVLDQIKKLEDDREAARDHFSDMLSDFIGNSQDILSDLQAGKAGSARANHSLGASSYTAPSAPARTEAAAQSYTTPNVSSTAAVAPVAATPSAMEKDFSGFGDTDDGFEFDDVD